MLEVMFVGEVLFASSITMDVYAQAFKVLAGCRPPSGQEQTQDGKSKKSGHSDGLQHSSSLPRSGSSGAGAASQLPPLPQSPASQQRRQRHSQQHKARKGQSGAKHGVAQGSEKPAVGSGSSSWAAPLPLTPTQAQPLTPLHGPPSTPVYAAPVTPARHRGPESRSAGDQGEGRIPLHSPSSSTSPRHALRRRGPGPAADAGEAAAAQQLERRANQGGTEPSMSDVEKAVPTVSEPLTLGGGQTMEAGQSEAATSSADKVEDPMVCSEAEHSVPLGPGPSPATDRIAQVKVENEGDSLSSAAPEARAQVKQEDESPSPSAAPSEALATQSQALRAEEQARHGSGGQGQGGTGTSPAPSSVQHEASSAVPGDAAPGTLVKEEPVNSEVGQGGAEPQSGSSRQAQALGQPPGALEAPSTTTLQPPGLVQSPSMNKSQSSRQQGPERGQQQTLATAQGAGPGQSVQGQVQNKGSKDPPPPPPPPPVRLGYALRFKLWALVEEMHSSFKEDDVTALQALVLSQARASQGEPEAGSTRGTPSSSPAKGDKAGAHAAVPAATATGVAPAAVEGETVEDASITPAADPATASARTGPPAHFPAPSRANVDAGVGEERGSGAGEEASEVQAELDRCTMELAGLAPKNQALLEAGLRGALPTMQGERRKEDLRKASLGVVSLILAQQREVKRQGRRDRREKEAQAVLAAATAAVAASPRVSHVRRVGGPGGAEAPGPGGRVGEWAGTGEGEGAITPLPGTPSGPYLQGPISPGGRALVFTFPQTDKDSQGLVPGAGTPLVSPDGIKGSVLALGSKSGTGKQKRQRGTPGASSLGKGSKQRGVPLGQGAGVQPLSKRRKGEAGQGLPSPLSRAGDQGLLCAACGGHLQAEAGQLAGAGQQDLVPAEGEARLCTCGALESSGGAALLRVPLCQTPLEGGRCALCLRRDGTLSEVQGDGASAGLPALSLHGECKKALQRFLKSSPEAEGELPPSAWAVVPTLSCAIQEIFRAPLALQMKLRPSVATLLNACLPQSYKYISINSSAL